MNCSILDDEDYVYDITEKIPIWLAEGRKDLSDRRSFWDWLKYNIRAHTIQLSKRKARERNEREQNLQEEYAKAKCIFETDPNDRKANTLNSTLSRIHHGKSKLLTAKTNRSRQKPKRWSAVFGQRSPMYLV